MHSAFLRHLAAQAPIMFLAIFAQIHAVDAGGGCLFERARREQRAYGELRIVRVVAGVLAIKIVVVELSA